MTRIRYKYENGLLTSKPMIAGLDLILMTVDPTKFTYIVTSVNTGAVLAQSEPYTSLPSVKIGAKTCAKVLGVVFDDEVRDGKLVASNEQSA